MPDDCPMKIEKLDMVTIAVNNLGEARQFYERLFDTKFELHQTKIKEAVEKWGISPLGLELLESPARVSDLDTFRSIQFRVPDVEMAKDEMRIKGFEPIEEVKMGELREAIYHIRGIRIVLKDFKGRTS